MSCVYAVSWPAARLVLVAAVAFLIPWLASAEPASRDLVRLENEAGRAQLAIDLRANRQGAGFRSSRIEGYPLAAIGRRGQAISSLSARPECQFTIGSSHGLLRRQGWLMGRSGRWRQAAGRATGRARRIRECRWEPSPGW